jgi:hypothetical protein
MWEQQKCPFYDISEDRVTPNLHEECRCHPLGTACINVKKPRNQPQTRHHLQGTMGRQYKDYQIRQLPRVLARLCIVVRSLCKVHSLLIYIRTASGQDSRRGEAGFREIFRILMWLHRKWNSDCVVSRKHVKLK